MADLLTLTELKNQLGISITDTRQDTQLSALIPVVSTVIRNFTERDFGSAAVTETRNFEYDGSGYLDIDDAASITTVVLRVPNGTDITLSTDAWYAAPPRRDDAPVFYYVVINGLAGINPYMGFTQNLDVLYEEGRFNNQVSTVGVTGQWGWPVVPDDVKLAAVWTIQDWTTKPANEALTGEAIESYSKSYAKPIGGGTALAIPNKARDLLSLYQKSQS